MMVHCSLYWEGLEPIKTTLLANLVNKKQVFIVFLYHPSKGYWAYECGQTKHLKTTLNQLLSEINSGQKPLYNSAGQLVYSPSKSELSVYRFIEQRPDIQADITQTIQMMRVAYAYIRPNIKLVPILQNLKQKLHLIDLANASAPKCDLTHLGVLEVINLLEKG
jgi:hypothetical protein